MSVSIKQLKAFVAVVEENSFSLAAERLNATQSGMSMLVQNLELSIGKKLSKDSLSSGHRLFGMAFQNIPAKP